MAADSVTSDVSTDHAERLNGPRWRLRSGLLIGLLVASVMLWMLWPSKTYDRRFVGSWMFQQLDNANQTCRCNFQRDGSVQLMYSDDPFVSSYQWYVMGDVLVLQTSTNAPPKSFLKSTKHVARDLYRRASGQPTFDPRPEKFRIIRLDEETCVLESLTGSTSDQLVLTRQAE